MVGALWAAGCGGGGVAIEDLGSELEDALCESRVACGFFPDVETCRATVFVEADSEVPQLEADVAAGLVAYDEDLARECLDGLASLGCEVFVDDNTIDDVCERVFTGLVEVGGTCFDDIHCADRGGCDIASCGPDECCTGVCAPGEPVLDPVPIGGDCSDAECVSDAFCNFDELTGDARCEAKLAEGEACDEFDACASPTFCDLDFTTGVGLCRRLPAEGEACDPEDSFLACERIDNFCDLATSVCRKRLAPGEACSTERNECVGFAFCNASAVCEALPVEGEACGGLEFINCMGDLDCVGDVCTAPEAGAICVRP